VERILAPGQSKAGLNSIAVLPFRNLGPEPDHDYFSDGLSEELIHRLTTVPNLRVVAWHSAARLKSSEYDLEQVRQQLKVDTVLCGTVRRAGSQLRITVQLIDTAEGRYLWSEIYERRLQDLFAIEEEIACAIVNTLQIRLGRTSAIPSAKQNIHNVEAYNLYLLGRFHANRRTSEGLLKSIHCLEKAVALDTNNALAHGSLAESYSLAGSYNIGYPTEYVSLARAAAHRALELDPARAEAYVTLAFVRSTYDWEWADGERLYRRAIELNPGYATAHHWFGIDHLALLGRWDEAWEEMELARRLDPLSAIILQGKGYLFLLTREYEKAVRAYEELIELDPLFSKGFASMGRAFLHLGRYVEAIEMFLKAQSLSGELPNLLGALGQAYAQAGMETAAREMLHKLKAQAEHGYVPGTCLALIHIGLAENEKALEYLELGAQRRDLPVVTLKVHPAYDPLRDSPRFQALLRTIGFS
jgi:serine/threonine-protein kinase